MARWSLTSIFVTTTDEFLGAAADYNSPLMSSQQPLPSLEQSIVYVALEALNIKVRSISNCTKTDIDHYLGTSIGL